MFRGKLKKIENDILEVRKSLEQHNGGLIITEIDYLMSDENTEQNRKKFLHHRLETLEKERTFLLDRRSSWFPKTIWNVIVPIFVAVATTYFLVKFGLK